MTRTVCAGVVRGCSPDDDDVGDIMLAFSPSPRDSVGCTSRVPTLLTIAVYILNHEAGIGTKNKGCCWFRKKAGAREPEFL